MRNWIIGAAALLAVAAPGIAAAQTGYAGAVYSNSDTDGGDDSDAWGAEGAVAFAGSGSIVFEVDASIIEPEEGDTGSALVGHVYSRNENHLFGGFIGIADASDSTTWFAGLEANKYLANWTFAGAVVYGNNDDANTDGFGVNLEARAFVHDNLRLQGNVGWASVDGDAIDDDVLMFGAGGEYLLTVLPISIALTYAHAEFDEADAESDTIAVAVRWNWGGTLRDRDRSGASQANVVGIASGFVS